MTQKQRTTTSFSSSSRTNKALHRRIKSDLAQIKQCQLGAHDMQVTQSSGVVVCAFCRMVGVCLWCGVIPPQGAHVVPCPAHAHLATTNVARAAVSTTYFNGKEQLHHVSHRG